MIVKVRASAVLPNSNEIDPFHCLRLSLIILKLKQSVSCIRQSERVIKNRPWIRDVQTRIKAQKSTTASKYFLT